MSTPSQRFTIDNPVAGFIEAHPAFGPALKSARSLAKLTGITHYVYDRMARRGAVHLWQVNEDGKVCKEERRGG